ncbi:calmodulin-binding transcription activator 4-like isoform X1 [Salvia splendens]|uniref:calmodulin-binding transcription activator 4-like isoform X1 n=1 Tax=Salvia splendens TaxID=180675 RepID=UPI001C26308C|nr:calmodulin-binding transcription activator 4-like isoform X1 [Salvia splendens]
MQSVIISGYDINHLGREAQSRWLKPAEVCFILKNYAEHQLAHQVPQKPTSGSLYLFNQRVLKFFRKDGHSWRKRKDQRTIAEAHERLKVGNAEALNCYYAHGEENPKFQRRSYWMLDPAYGHIVLVHYRDIRVGRENSGSASQLPTSSPSTFSLNPASFASELPDPSFVIGESYELYHNDSSPNSVEISSSQIVNNHTMNRSEERANEVSGSSRPDTDHTFERIKHQLSLNDDEETVFNKLYFVIEDSNDLDVLREYELSNLKPTSTGNIHPLESDSRVQQYQKPPGTDVDIWKEMLDGSKNFPSAESPPQFGGHETFTLPASLILEEVDSQKHHTYTPIPHAYHPACSLPVFYQDGLEISLDNNINLTIAQKQRFTIREISPEWCYTSEGTKIIIIGSFFCDPSECEWACMIGDVEVPVQIIQKGVLSCYAPAHLQGEVSICITSGNREACSEVRDFEYRAKSEVSTHSDITGTEAYKNPDELVSLVRFVQMLLSQASESRTDEDSWSQVIDTVLVGTSTSSSILDWLLQELLKDKLDIWLSSKIQNSNEKGCLSLSKKEQGIIHMVAILGFEWALQPILNSGVSVNFRDNNGWTALHWAARYGREKMVSALIAFGASAGAVTDPNAQDLTGKTPASIAASYGHRGLAGYLSEVELTTHLTSLTLVESELSKGSAALEAERTVNSTPSSDYEDEGSLRQTLAAVCNAAQAAALIQSAFRVHSFRKRQQLKSAIPIGRDEFNDIQGLSTASKLAFRTTRDNNLAAVSIQKTYRGWKGRKDFLSLRQKVVKIQAHVRGYQVRRNYMVCWAVGVLEKVILRWRRRGVGLRGFRAELESIDESEGQDILKVFRKQKVDEAIDEAVSRVLSMVECPEARQQYRRLLSEYRQAKAKLQNGNGITQYPNVEDKDTTLID